MSSEQSEVLQKVLRYMRRYWFYLAISILLAAIPVASTLYIPLPPGDAVACLVGKGHVDWAGVFAVLKQMAMVIGVTALAQWGMNICNNKLTYQIVRDIRNEAFAKLEILPLKYIDQKSTGEIVSRIIADVDQFADGLLMGFTQLFTGAAKIIGTLGFMLSVDVNITFVVVLITQI